MQRRVVVAMRCMTVCMRSARACVAPRQLRRLPNHTTCHPTQRCCRYVREREQFGSALGSFQLVQERMARMLGNIQVRMRVGVHAWAALACGACMGCAKAAHAQQPVCGTRAA